MFANGAAVKLAAQREDPREDMRSARQQEAISNSLNWYEMAFRTLPVGIAIAEDADCRVTRCNRALADLLGMEGEATEPMWLPHPSMLPCRLYAEGKQLEHHEFPLHRAVRERQELPARRYEIIRQRGHSVSALVHARPILTSDQTATGSVALFINLENWQGAEQARREMDFVMRMRLLAAGVTHSVNNMLAAVMLNTSMALETLEPSHPSHDFVEVSLQASERIARMIRQIGLYSGYGSHNQTAIDIAAVIAAGEQRLRDHVPSGVRLELALERVPAVEGNPADFTEALHQVIDNAAEAVGGADATITVRTGLASLSAGDLTRLHAGPETRGPGRYVYVQVEDNGSGIDAGNRERVFDPFFTTKFFGRGLGLPVVAGIVRCHHGVIEIESEAGHGTLVTAYFPAMAAAGEASASVMTPAGTEENP